MTLKDLSTNSNDRKNYPKSDKNVSAKNSDLKSQERIVREIEIERLASDGAGVGYINGKATFVPGLLPGESGKIKVIEEKKNYQRAELLSVSKLSAERQDPPCPVYQECGGCDLQHLQYAATLRWKKQWVEDALQRIGGLSDIQAEPVLGMEEPWRYRNKAVLHRDNKGRLGYYRQKSKDVAEFTDCLLLSESTNNRIKRMREIIGKDYTSINTITFRESNRGKGLVLLDRDLKQYKQEQSSDRQYINNKSTEINALIKELVKYEEFSLQSCSIAVPKGKTDIEGSGAQYLNEYLDDLPFKVSPRAFLQVNPKQTAKLYSLILDYAKLKGEEEIWDLYCGIGTITLMLAKRAGRAVGIEENTFAVEDAVINAAKNEISNVTFVQGKVEDKLKSLPGNPDIIVCDPPRAGMDPLVLENLLKLQPQKIIYVSCNPATLARDLKVLTGNDEGTGYDHQRNDSDSRDYADARNEEIARSNSIDKSDVSTHKQADKNTKTSDRTSYRIIKVQPVDMFPWTSHVETVTLITKV